MARMFASGSPVAGPTVAASITSAVSSSVAAPFAAVSSTIALITLIVARRRSFLGFDSHFGITVGHGCLAGEADTAFFINAQAFDPDFIAHFDDVFGLLDAEVGELADVNEAVFAGQEFDKRAEILNRDHLAAVDLVDFGFGSHAHDGIAGDLHAFFGNRVDIDRAVVLDVDFAAGLFDQPLDILATGA